MADTKRRSPGDRCITTRRFFLLALGTGMRQGEVVALKRQDVNPDTGTLQVRRVLSHVDQRFRKKGAPAYIEAEPKTESSRRTIVLPRFVIDALIAHRVQMPRVAGKARRGIFIYP